MSTLFKTRVIVLRLLATFRFLKSPYLELLEKSKENAEKNEKRHRNIDYREIISRIKEHPLSPLPKIPKEMRFIEEKTKFKKNKILNFAKLFEREIPDRLKNFKINGNVIIFIVPNEYTLIIKRKTDQKFFIKYFTVYFSKFSRNMERTIKQLTCVLQSYMKDPSLCLAKIDRLLHSIFIYGIMGKVVEKMAKMKTSFPYRISYNNVWINFDFAEGFGAQRRLILSQFKGKIIFSCPAPLYIPNEDLPEVFIPGTVYATPHTFALPSEGSANLNSRVVYLEIPLEEPTTASFDYCMDILIFTRLINCWNPLMKVLTCYGATFVTPVLRWIKNASSLSRIEVNAGTTLLMTIHVDVTTGAVIVNFAGREITMQNFVDWTTQPSFPYTLFNIIFDLIFKTRSRFSYRMDLHKNFQSGYIAINVSPCPNFVVFYESKLGVPRLLIFDKEGNQYETPETVELKNMSVRMSWVYVDTLSGCIKKILFIMEVERICKEKGIKTSRAYTRLRISSREFSIVELSVVGLTRWKLKFWLNSAIFTKITCNNLVFTGTIDSARSPQFVMHVYDKVDQLLLLIVQLGFASKKSQIMKSLTMNYAPDVSFKINNDKIEFQVSIVSTNNAFIFQGSSPTKVFYDTTFFSPGILISIVSSNVLSNGLKKISSSFTTTKFIGYINHSIIPLYNLYEYCKNNNWEIVNWSSPTVFQLIYHKIYTISVELKTMHIYSICFSSHLPCAALLVPLVSIKAITAAASKGAYRMKYETAKFQLVLSTIEAFVKRYEEVQEAGFGNPVMDSSKFPKIMLSSGQFRCALDREKIIVLCNDSYMNDLIINIPKNGPNLKLMLRLSSDRMLFITVFKFLSILSHISPEEETNAVETLTFKESGCLLYIRNYRFVISYNIVTTSERVFSVDDYAGIDDFIRRIAGVSNNSH